MQHNDFIELTQDSYPTYDDLIISTTNVKTTPVNQYELKDKEVGSGICSGLSVTHIKQTLHSKEQKSKNPFSDNKAIDESIKIQFVGGGNSLAARRILNRDWFLTTSLSNHIGNNIDNAGHNSLKNNIAQTIQGTAEDGKARGVYIGYDIARVPLKKPIERVYIKSGHAISMTVQKKYNGKLVCTALDSNLFFAKGKGTAGCDQIVDKLVDTVKAYHASNITTINVIEESFLYTCTLI